LTTDISVGDHTSLNIRCSIGHDASIGSFCQLSSYSDVTGGVTLEDDVFLGSHASILPGVVVAKGATIGAGSIAISKVRSGTTVMGVPARVLKS
jgi:acetyltransferase-like isoleucine patch superfamily enzyme